MLPLLFAACRKNDGEGLVCDNNRMSDATAISRSIESWPAAMWTTFQAAPVIIKTCANSLLVVHINFEATRKHSPIAHLHKAWKQGREIHSSTDQVATCTDSGLAS
jgi:hypothetical protein